MERLTGGDPQGQVGGLRTEIQEEKLTFCCYNNNTQTNILDFKKLHLMFL